MGTLVRLLRARRALYNIALIAPKNRSILQRLIIRFGEGPYYRTFSRRFGSHIGIEAKIGEDALFPHEAHGVFISGLATIGDRATILQHVTIGVAGKNRAAPVIGNDVLVGANCTIVGACIIGDGAKIGAGVTLVDAVIPPGAIIINKSAFNLTEGKPVYS